MDMRAFLQLFLSFAFASGPVSAKGNYYDALALGPGATRGQIKKAFRSLALKFHPDKNKSALAEMRFREIAEAYKVLSSSEERKLYDLLGHEAYVSGGPHGGHSFHQEADSFDFDEDYFDFDEDSFDFEEDLWTFPDDDVFDHHTFHGQEFTFEEEAFF